MLHVLPKCFPLSLFPQNLCKTSPLFYFNNYFFPQKKRKNKEKKNGSLKVAGIL